ncbi:MAG: hypothetical protein ACI8PZ_005201 [Myxococcota bacterium]|jgi:hypothetical protein
MNGLRRFKGSVVALVVLVLVAVLVWWVPDPSADEAVYEPPRIFRFEKEDLVGIRIIRSELTISLAQDGAGSWRFTDRSWRPSRSMVRRVGHQLHDLSARAEVVSDPEEPARYGLGGQAIRVEVDLRDGSSLSFEAGDPNPTSVSWYMRPLPDGPVFVVKKAALDYYRAELDDFREDKFAFFDASDAVAIEAEVDGRRMTVERIGEKSWRMGEPVEQLASRDEVRMMLGRVSALKAFGFVADAPTQLSHLGLDPPQHQITIRLASGDAVSLLLGHEIEGSDPPQRYIYRAEDDAVYAARDGLLEAFRKPVEAYRNRVLVGRHEWDVEAMDVSLAGELVRIVRTADDWRWPDGSVVQGSTDKRVAGRAAELQAVAFPDIDGESAGLGEPWAGVALEFTDGSVAAIALGAAFEAPGPDGEPPRVHRYAQIIGDDAVYAVDSQLPSVIEDLHREYRRKQERDAEKNLDGDALP